MAVTGAGRRPIEATKSLVGRENETALLRAAVDDAHAGRSRVVLIAGEPGIGKTALAEDAAARAGAAGAFVAWGTGWEGEGAPAYWPWIQIIRSYAAGVSTGDLLADLGEGAADIARLVPEVGGRFLSLSHNEQVDPDRARFRLFDNVAAFLRAAAARRPMCLILDDLHWADRSSLELLAFFTRASRDARVAVVGTYRDVELEASQRDLIASLAGERIALSGLGPGEVTSLIRLTTGADPASELAGAVYDRTTGNPFFVKEVARLLHTQGRLDDAAASPALAIPERVRDVVRRRLTHLDQETVRVLGVASVIGAEFGIDLLGEVAVMPGADLLSRLDAAAAARLVAEVPGSVGRYAFAHSLVRDVLYEDLGAAQRAALHWRTGEALGARSAQETYRSEIAHHLVRGATAGDPAVAAGAAVAAARAAIRMYAWDQAAELFSRALDVFAIAAGADPLARLQTMLELGDARIRTSDLAAAREVFIAAAELAADQDRPTELAHAALGIGGGLSGFEVPLFDESQMDLLHRALDRLPPDDSAVRAWVLARLSVASSFVLSESDREALSREAIAMARRIGDRGALSYGLSSLCDAIAGPDHVADRVAASTEMIELSAQPAEGAARCGIESCAVCLCDPEFALLGRRLRIVANLERGDVTAVDRDIDAYSRLAEHLRQPLFRWYVPLFAGMRAMLRGDLDAAARHLAETDAFAATTGSENAVVLARTQRIGLSLERGDDDEAGKMWDWLLGISGLERLPSTPAMRAVQAALFKDEVAGRPALRGWVAQGGIAALPKDAEWLTGGVYGAECALRLRDPEAAEHMYDALAPYEDLFAVDGIAAHVMGAVSHYLGRLAGLLGRTGDAERHLDRAIAAHAAIGAPLWEERSRAELARLRGEDAGEQRSTVATGANVWRREGEFWTAEYEGTVARLKDSKGMRDIALLLSTPGREMPALDLVRRHVGPAAPEGHAGELLDDRARNEYKARIAELQAEIDDAATDPDRAADAREELDALADQLSAAYGLGGRARRAGDPAERARKAVTERIRDAVAKVGREHPALHRHLKASIKTGAYCSYQPERPTVWQL